MRARLAICATGQTVELREILLKEKPEEMLAASSKGTVPVLVLANNEANPNVIDESLDIMLWAVKQASGTELNLPTKDDLALIQRNDDEFKYWLDRYKYHVGYPEHPMDYYRDKAKFFLKDLDKNLAETDDQSLSNSGLFVDLAIFPFVRQFAYVDKNWFDQQSFQYLHIWLNRWLESDIFNAVMPKFPQWHSGEKAVEFAAKPIPLNQVR